MWFEVLSGCLFVTQAGGGFVCYEGLGGRFVTEKVIFARVVGLIKVNHIEEEVNLISRGAGRGQMQYDTCDKVEWIFFSTRVIIES